METLANGLNAEITTTAPCCITVHVVVPVETVKKTYSSILGQYGQKVVRPGFRAGHTPRPLILSLYGKNIAADTEERLINQSLQQVVSEKKLRLAADFQLEGNDGKPPAYQADKPYDFTVTAEVFEDFTLPQYKGLDIQKQVEPIEDKKVDEAAETFLRAHGKYDVVERASEAGDMLKVDYTTDADEELKAVKEASYLLGAKNSWQMLRQPESIPGVAEALVGLKQGDEKDVAVTFPADFRIEALQGKTINYHFTVNEVHGFTPAEQTPELFKQYGCEDLAGMKAILRKRMEDQSEHNAIRKMEQQIHDQLTAELNFPLPPTLVKNAVDHELEHAVEHLRKDGATEEKIAEERPAKEAEIRERIEQDYRFDLALERIAEAEKLQVPPQDFYQYCYGMAQQSGMAPDEFMKKISGNSQYLNSIFGTLLRLKALEFIRNNVKGAEAPAAAETAEPEAK